MMHSWVNQRSSVWASWQLGIILRTYKSEYNISYIKIATINLNSLSILGMKNGNLWIEAEASLMQSSRYAVCAMNALESWQTAVANGAQWGWHEALFRRPSPTVPGSLHGPLRTDGGKEQTACSASQP
jgi:hypothetical protein